MPNYFRLTVLAALCSILYFTYLEQMPSSVSLLQRRAPATTMIKRDSGTLSPVAVLLKPVGGEVIFATSSLTIQWKPDPKADIPLINIDLYDASRPVRFFVLSIANNLDVSTTSYTWTIPNNIATSTTYIVRVWGPYKVKTATYWQVPDSNIFTITRYPLGISGPTDGLWAGGSVNVRFFASQVKISSENGLTVSVIDTKSSDPMYRDGLVLASKLPISTTSFAWNVPVNFPNSTTYQFQVAGVLKESNSVILDQSTNFPILGGYRDSRLSLSVEPKSAAPKDRVTINFLWDGEANGNTPFQTWSLFLYSKEKNSPYYNEPLRISQSLSPAVKSATWDVVNVGVGGTFYIYFAGEHTSSSGPVVNGRTELVINTKTTNQGFAVVKPTASDTWEAGQAGLTTWTLEGSKNASIASWSVELFSKTSSGEKVFVSKLGSTSVAINARSLNWIVPSAVPGLSTYFVRVVGMLREDSPEIKQGFSAMVAESATFTIKSEVKYVVEKEKTLGGNNFPGDASRMLVSNGWTWFAAVLGSVAVLVFA